MQKAEIKVIVDYLKDLEEGLYDWDYRGRKLYESEFQEKITEEKGGDSRFKFPVFP